VIRGDFHYWLPIDGAFGLLASLLLRVIIKTITDCTGVIQFRLPNEVGEQYWTFNMFLALLTSFVSMWIYYEMGEGKAIEEDCAWLIVGLLSGMLVLSFGVLVLTMKKKYRYTFLSTRLGKQSTMDYFLLSEDDATIMSIFQDNELRWLEIRDPIKEFVLSNSWRWKADEPDWSTLNFVASLPLDMVPEENEAKEARRRNSIFGGVSCIPRIPERRKLRRRVTWSLAATARKDCLKPGSGTTTRFGCACLFCSEHGSAGVSCNVY